MILSGVFVNLLDGARREMTGNQGERDVTKVPSQTDDES